MIIFEKEKMEQALKFADIGQHIGDSWDNSSKYSVFEYVFEIETHLSSPVPIASFIASKCISNCKCALQFESTAVWKSGQDIYLIQCLFEKLFGEGASIFSDGAVIVANKNEQKELCSVIHLAMISGWDILGYNGSKIFQFEISHDGKVVFYVSNSDAKEFEKDFGLSTGRQLALLE